MRAFFNSLHMKNNAVIFQCWQKPGPFTGKSLHRPKQVCPAFIWQQVIKYLKSWGRFKVFFLKSLESPILIWQTCHGWALKGPSPLSLIYHIPHLLPCQRQTSMYPRLDSTSDSVATSPKCCHYSPEPPYLNFPLLDLLFTTHLTG